MQKMIKGYPETHQVGYISVEKEVSTGLTKGDLGIQIAEDGRIWICLNGVAWIRFRPAFLDKARVVE